MRQLGELEAAVMDVIWAASGSVTVRTVLDAVNARRRRRQLAYTTVLSVMTNLHAKGLLTRQPAGRAFSFAPAITREAYTAALMTNALAGAVDRRAVLLQFAAALNDTDRAMLLRHQRPTAPPA